MTIDGRLMPLRGLPVVPCKLHVTFPARDTQRAETIIVEFTPNVSTPTAASIDLRPFER